jgi:fructose-1,6-bisphosphatase/inositol monophosphatase family enzyme
MIDPALHRWDAVAVLPIIEEAGGRFCDWSGERRIESGQAVASNLDLMPSILEILQSR